MKSKPTKDYYDAAINRMRKRMAKWRKDNPTKTASIQFRSDVVVIGTAWGAYQAGILLADKGGYELLKAMCEPEKHEPTYMMVKAVLE